MSNVMVFTCWQLTKNRKKIKKTTVKTKLNIRAGGNEAYGGCPGPSDWKPPGSPCSVFLLEVAGGGSSWDHRALTQHNSNQSSFHLVSLACGYSRELEQPQSVEWMHFYRKTAHKISALHEWGF